MFIAILIFPRISISRLLLSNHGTRLVTFVLFGNVLLSVMVIWILVQLLECWYLNNADAGTMLVLVQCWYWNNVDTGTMLVLEQC